MNKHRPYRTVLTLPLLLLTAMHALSAQVTTTSAVFNKPILHIVEGYTLEFGTRPPGHQQDTFHITNIGNDTLIIHYLKSSCGCLVGELEKYRLAPGDTSRVFVHFNGSRSGILRKSFRLLSNDPDRPEVTLRVQMTVVNDLELHPYPGFIILNGKNGKGKGAVRLRNVHNSAISITDVRIAPGDRNMVFAHNITDNVTLEPGEEFELIIEAILHAPSDRANIYHDTRLVLHTTGPYHPELKLTLYYCEPMSSREKQGSFTTN